MRESDIKRNDERNRKGRAFFISSFFLLTYFEPYLNFLVGSLLKYYIFVVIVGLVAFSRRFIFQGYHYAVISWLLYKFFTLLWTTDTTIFERHYETHLSSVALLIFISALDDCEDCCEVIKKTLWTGSAIIGFLSIFMSKAYEGEANRQVLTIFGAQNDPNNQAAFLMYGLAISLYYLLYEKKHKLLHIIVIGINCYATLLTGSRGGLLSIAAVFLGYIITLYDKQTLKANYKRIFSIAALIVVAAIVLLSVLPTDVSERLFDFESYESGNNRDIMWRHGFSILSSPANLVIGSGWGAYKTGGYSSLHNTFISTLCDVGIIGFLLFFGPVFKAAFSMMKKKNILPFTILIGGMLPSFFIEAINKRFFWNAIIFVFVAYNCHLKEESKRNPRKKLKQNR